MFNKKKQQSLYNSVDDSRSTVYDFTLRSTPIGFESYRTTEYTLYHKLDEAEMLPRIDDHLEKLFAGNVDDANGDMLDEIIFGAAREALPYLSKQHIFINLFNNIFSSFFGSKFNFIYLFNNIFFSFFGS